ncbi:hypothetical protein PPL_04057 [Heterostelium album PN500]|uniref:Uncharacterized protein n=1 Tax=Heterostelium pallidum (strain ATCC 26659 / Pp 5 / PN500) TaxID=670386 RepID=D3B5W9_HETP5|nr:hypothetical protein PPL_04057 [Heterostelium album PN500]EFA83267.1 hypothetical protein PPL_04057 [Heterostelium album PN500]|eukprot:XP_020435384.1 hypothetical protein PPL_04057 [Heterostelium album PN500]
MASIRQLELIIHEAHRVNKSLLDDLLTLKEDKKLTNTQLNVALGAKEKLESKYEKVKKELDESKKKLEDFQANLTEFENENTKLNVEYKASLESIEQKTGELAKLEQQMSVLTSENSELLAQKQKLESRAEGNIIDKEKQIENLGKELKLLNEKLLVIDVERGKSDKLKQDEQKKRVEAETYSKGLEKRIEELEERLAATEVEVGEKNKLREKIKERSELVASLEEELKKLRVDLEKERAESATMQLEFEKMLENEQTNRTEIIDGTERQVMLLENDLKAEKNRSAELEKLRDRNIEESQQMKEIFNKLQFDYLELEKKYSDLQQQQKEQQQQQQVVTTTTIDEETMKYDELLICEKERYRKLEMEYDQLKKRIDSSISSSNGNEDIDQQLDRNSSDSSTEDCSNDESILPDRDDNENDEHEQDQEVIVVDVSDSDKSMTTTTSSSSSLLEDERKQLRQWEERIEQRYQQTKQILNQIKEIKEKTPTPTVNENNSNNNNSNSNNNDTAIFKKHLESMILDLKKQLESEKKSKSKLEDQVQQLQQQLQHQQHQSSSSSSSATSFLSSPVKLTSLFTKRNHSVNDFSSTHSANAPSSLSANNNNNNNNNHNQETSTSASTSTSSTTNSSESSSPSNQVLVSPPNESAESDQDRKSRLFKAYQDLLVECNTILYSKKDQLAEIEESGKAYFKLIQVHQLKASIGKLEPMHEKLKKQLIYVDSKDGITSNEELDEKNLIKTFQSQVDQESPSK